MPPSREQLVHLTENPVAFLNSEDVTLRRIAITALTREQADANFDSLSAHVAESSAAVRAATAEKLGYCDDRPMDALEVLGNDTDPTVREAVATAYGELARPQAVPWLMEASLDDDDRHVKEAAVAALGAIGDPAAIDTLLKTLEGGPPQVRRRAIAAITVFDDERIEPAIQRAALDRNPGVREAAEMVVGKQITPSE
ncbi:MAG: HEAT repeat domain-containing protein [Acidimicrobiia bacterium]